MANVGFDVKGLKPSSSVDSFDRLSRLVVTAKLISAFVFATRIVQSLFYLYPKFQASSSFCACKGRFVSDLFGNHIVGFPTRRLRL